MNTTEITSKYGVRYESPRSGKPIVRSDSERLLRYMVSNEGRLDLTSPTIEEDLQHIGVKRAHVAKCICNLRQYYGVEIVAVYKGRRVVMYTLA